MPLGHGLGVVEPPGVPSYAGTRAVFDALVEVDPSDGDELEVCTDAHSSRMVDASLKPHARSRWSDEKRLSNAAACTRFPVTHDEKGATWNGIDGIYDLRLSFRVLSDCAEQPETVTVRSGDEALETGLMFSLKAQCLGAPVWVTTARPLGDGRIALTFGAAPVAGASYTVMAGERTWPLRPPGGTITIPALGPHDVVEARVSFKDGYSFRTPLYDQSNLSPANDENGAQKAKSAPAPVPGPSGLTVLVAVALLAVVSRRKPRRYA